MSEAYSVIGWLASRDPSFALGFQVGTFASIFLTADPPVLPIFIDPRPVPKSNKAAAPLSLATPSSSAGAVCGGGLDRVALPVIGLDRLLGRLPP